MLRSILFVPFVFRQGIGNHVIANPCLHEMVAPGHDDQVLTTKACSVSALFRSTGISDMVFSFMIDRCNGAA
jgi:hypothetical protein